MAKTCAKCETNNPDTSKFCGECGEQPWMPSDIEATETTEASKEELTTGSTFSGRYEIIEELGKEGRGKVYRALDKEVKEEVALKLIRPDIARDKKAIERYVNEIKFAPKDQPPKYRPHVRTHGRQGHAFCYFGVCAGAGPQAIDKTNRSIDEAKSHRDHKRDLRGLDRSPSCRRHNQSRQILPDIPRTLEGHRPEIG